MNALGYALAPMVLDAADHGVPQQRRRLVHQSVVPGGVVRRLLA